MARRRVVVDGEPWEIFPSGRTTVYGRDEFGLVFENGTGPDRKRRFARYSPVGSRFRDASLLELPEQRLIELFRQSQPAWTAPESAYDAR
ncbi:MAG TPA: hypothetical protein VF978_00160 [Gemmatimonadales bacterium]